MSAPQPPVWTPIPDAVGEVIARLIPDASGQITGTFTTTTIPTTVQVADIIASITSEVLLIAPSIPPEVGLFAARVVVLGAAAQITSAFFPEIPGAYVAQLRQDYLDNRALLITAANRVLSGQAGAMAVQALQIHSTRPLPPFINPYQNPYIDPMWPY